MIDRRLNNSLLTGFMRTHVFFFFFVANAFDIYKIIMTSCQTFYCTNEKGECEKNCFFCNYRSVNTTKNTGKYDSIGDKKEKSRCTHKTS